MKSEMMGCPETSVMNYHYTLRNSPEECSYHPIRGGNVNLTVSFSLVVKTFLISWNANWCKFVADVDCTCDKNPLLTDAIKWTLYSDAAVMGLTSSSQ